MLGMTLVGKDKRGSDQNNSVIISQSPGVTEDESEEVGFHLKTQVRQTGDVT